MGTNNIPSDPPPPPPPPGVHHLTCKLITATIVHHVFEFGDPFPLTLILIMEMFRSIRLLSPTKKC